MILLEVLLVWETYIRSLSFKDILVHLLFERVLFMGLHCSERS